MKSIEIITLPLSCTALLIIMDHVPSLEQKKNNMLTGSSVCQYDMFQCPNAGRIECAQTCLFAGAGEEGGSVTCMNKGCVWKELSQHFWIPGTSHIWFHSPPLQWIYPIRPFEASCLNLFLPLGISCRIMNWHMLTCNSFVHRSIKVKQQQCSIRWKYAVHGLSFCQTGKATVVWWCRICETSLTFKWPFREANCINTNHSAWDGNIDRSLHCEVVWTVFLWSRALDEREGKTRGRNRSNDKQMCSEDSRFMSILHFIFRNAQCLPFSLNSKKETWKCLVCGRVGALC